MLRLYNTALLPVRLGVALWAAWASRSEPGRREWRERRARLLPRVAPGGIWIHGASVGETRLVRGIAERVRRLEPDGSLSASAYTRAGRAQLPEPPAVDSAFFMPLDFPGATRKVLDAVRPRGLVLVETELWPNLMHRAHDQGAALVVLNGRLSPRRMHRYRRLSGLYRPLLERLAALGAQSDADAERFRELGVPERIVTVTGNVKYDLPLPATGERALRERLGIETTRAVWVAGSTAPGEESAVLDAFAEALPGRDELLLVLAPRHLTRVEEVAALVADRGYSCLRFSSGNPVEPGPGVLLVDTVGDLPALYRLATVAFVGGSLAPVGGHNVLEPAAVGAPVLFGPHVEHFREPVEALERAGGGRRVADAAELSRLVSELLDDPGARAEMGRRALSVVESNRGALDRSIDLLVAAIGPPPTESA